MAHPLTRNQQLENSAFLRALRRTGNVRLAARETGVSYGTLQHRRKRHPAFAARWDAAIAVAQARLNTGAVSKSTPGSKDAGPRPRGAAHRTLGGETVVVRRRDGTCQVRTAQPGKLTRACEQAFLAALSATANVRLSAAAAGASPRAFYRRQRRNPAFAREMQLALEQGYERIEMTLLAGMKPDAHADDAWRHNAPPEMPTMTVNQMLQLLYLHQKQVRLEAEPPHIKRRAGESREAHSYRMAAHYRANQERDRQAYLVAEARRTETAARSRHEPPAPSLPALDQVTGWSKASGRAAHDEGTALFGGWRWRDIPKRK